MKFISTLTGICSYLTLLMLPFNSTGQQPWMNSTKDKKNPNFHEVQQSFNNYWKGKIPEGKAKGKIPRGKGYKQFKRWEWFWEPRVGKQGNFPSSSVVMKEWEKYRSSHPRGQNLSQGVPTSTPPPSSTFGSWAPLGPSSSTGGYAGIGRLNCIAFHPTDPNTFWVGSPAGGLWKTTTGGTSWTTLTDNLPVLGVSAMVINPSNPNIMYIATGDRDAGDTYAVGILKSTNGGTSWNATGLSYSVSDRVLVKGLIMHPSNPLVLLAATSSGIYRTSNGGTSWTLEEPGNFQEILFKPGDPTTVYASSYGNDAQIFKSVNTGTTWSQVTSFSNIYRIALAVTPANPAIVGALCSNNYDYGFGGYYKSTNSGASFESTYAADELNLLGWEKNGTDAGGQGYYDLCLAISPTNANVIYLGGVNTWKSINGGSSWSISTMWYGGTGVPEVHADKHFMAFSPFSAGTLYQGNDGGLYKTSDDGTTWTDLSNGLGITQFYRMGNAATTADLTLAGAQDNGTKLRNSFTYTDVIGGDGMEAIIDYSNADIMYGSLYYGDIRKSTNGGASFTSISGSLPSGAWVTPYVIDPLNPEILYAGVNGEVYKTTDRGSTWAAISSDLSWYQLQSLAVAPSNPQTIYTGSYFSFYKTTTGGNSWSSLTLPTSTDAVTSIEIHPTDPQTLWITCSGYSVGSKVYKSIDGGESWTNISGTLPNLPANTIEYDKNTGVLYLGNDVGVFVRHPDMQDWQAFDTGLPNVIVNELEIQYSSSRLRAATYGRGLWESDLYTEPATYCVPVYTYGCSADDYINNFSFNTLVNNNSACSDGTATGYTNYSPTGTLTTTVYKGQSYRMKLQSGAEYTQYFGVWIDYNQDKDFDDAGEFVYASPSAETSVFTANISIPATAALGTTRLRVRSNYELPVASTESCTSINYGEAEDYTITIAAPVSQWNARFGGSSSDNFPQVIRTSDGGYLLGGSSNSGLSGDKTQNGRGDYDFWVVKTDASGNKQWDKRFGGSLDDHLNDIIQTSDGGYLLGGSSASGRGSDKTESSRGGTDYWLVKINSNGSKQWDKRFGGSGNDELISLGETSARTGNLYVAGHSTSGLSGDKSQGSQGGKDYWMLKLNSSGTKLWDKRFGGSSEEELRSIIITADGGYLLGGKSLSGVSGDKSQSSRGNYDYWLVKTNSSGVKQWDKRFGGSGNDELFSLGETSSTTGNLYVAGHSTSGLSGDKSQGSQGGKDYWMLKLNSSGTKLWDKRFGGSSEEELRSIILTADGGYLLGGKSLSGVSGDKSQSSRGNYDYWVVKTSSTGSKQWDKRFGGSSEEQLQTVLQTSDGSYLLAGQTASGASGDVTQPSRGGTDFWLVKFSSSSGRAVSVEPVASVSTNNIPATSVADKTEEATPAFNLVVAPNPVTDELTVSFSLPETQPVNLQLYDAQGRVVKILYDGEVQANKKYELEWRPLPTQAAGLYIVRFRSRSETKQQKIIYRK